MDVTGFHGDLLITKGEGFVNTGIAGTDDVLQKRVQSSSVFTTGYKTARIEFCIA